MTHQTKCDVEKHDYWRGCCHCDRPAGHKGDHCDSEAGIRWTQAPTAEQRAKRNAARKARADVYAGLGMVKVRGNLGGTYWE